MGFISSDNIKHLIGLIKDSLNKKVDLVNNVIVLNKITNNDEKSINDSNNISISPAQINITTQGQINNVSHNDVVSITSNQILVYDAINNNTLYIKPTGMYLPKSSSSTKVFATDGSLFDMSTKVSLKDGKIDGSQVKDYTIYESKWKTDTPFVINNGVITKIYKGECISDYVKWILIPLVDTEDQTYKAYSTSDSTYVYGEYNSHTGKYNAPWELWLPNNLKTGTVTIDWQ